MKKVEDEESQGKTKGRRRERKEKRVKEERGRMEREIRKE
jgi:hypothetical protein